LVIEWTATGGNIIFLTFKQRVRITGFFYFNAPAAVVVSSNYWTLNNNFFKAVGYWRSSVRISYSNNIDARSKIAPNENFNKLGTVHDFGILNANTFYIWTGWTGRNICCLNYVLE
jgi:hypothetical protein